jgi:hypothetical protein
VAEYHLLEDGSGHVLLEDGSSGLLLEATPTFHVILEEDNGHVLLEEGGAGWVLLEEAPTVIPPQTVQVQGIGDVVTDYLYAGEALAGQELVGFKAGGSRFGAPTVTTPPPVAKTVSPQGLGSAGNFGTVRTRTTVLVAGLGSAQRFGIGNIAFAQKVPVRGLSPGYVPHLCGMYLCGQALVGYDTSLGYQRFGVPLVRVFGIRPTPPVGVILYPTTETSLVLTPTAEVGEEELGDWIIRPTTEVPV